MRVDFIEPNVKMRLDGGIKTREDFNTGKEVQMGGRYKGKDSPRGRKVRHTTEGVAEEIYNGMAKDYLKENEIVTIEEIFVGSSGSLVRIQEHPEYVWNTVLFEDMEDTTDEN